jgi:dTMP kinase
MLITFEGIDGCGKSTQVKKCAASLVKMGYKVITTREPYGNAAKKALQNNQASPEGKLAILSRDRAHHVQKVIVPFLAARCIVLCDRFIDSTVAYQGYGDGLSIEKIDYANNLACSGLSPKLTICLDIPVFLALNRVNCRGSLDAIESQGLEYFYRVATGYRILQATNASRIRRVNGRGSVDAVAARIACQLSSYLAI